jgi:hypothetical protein
MKLSSHGCRILQEMEIHLRATDSQWCAQFDPADPYPQAPEGVSQVAQDPSPDHVDARSRMRRWLRAWTVEWILGLAVIALLGALLVFGPAGAERDKGCPARPSAADARAFTPTTTTPTTLPVGPRAAGAARCSAGVS